MSAADLQDYSRFDFTRGPAVLAQLKRSST
jgi:hypothetical protein